MTEAARCAGGVLIVANASARGRPVDLIGDLERIVENSGAEPVLLGPPGTPGNHPGDPDGGAARAVEMIQSAVLDDGPWSAVVSVGGDGTARTCAEALAGSDVAMVIVPAGTGNSMYRALWADAPWVETVEGVLNGSAGIRDIDLMTVKGEESERTSTVLLGASAGLIAEVLAVSADLTDVSGRDRYSEAIGPALESHRPFPARITVDGDVIADGPVSLVAIGGARHRSGTFELLPRSILDDGLADVCVIGGVDAEGFVELAGPVMVGEHIDHPAVTYAQGRHVRVERTDGLSLVFEHDGDMWPVEDRTVEVAVGGTVRMFAPLVAEAG